MIGTRAGGGVGGEKRGGKIGIGDPYLSPSLFSVWDSVLFIRIFVFLIILLGASATGEDRRKTKHEQSRPGRFFDVFGLSGPNVLFQPGHQGDIVGEAP